MTFSGLSNAVGARAGSPERSPPVSGVAALRAGQSGGDRPATRPGKGGARVEYNGLMEKLEQKLYERLEAMLDADRWDDAAKVVELMTSCGIV